MMFYLKGIINALTGLWQIATAPNAFEVVVTKAIDGDSILGKDANGVTHNIRIRGADAPELPQPGGKEAKDATNNLLLNKIVTLKDPETDRYGRTAAAVETKEGIDAAEHLTKSGLAWACHSHGQIRHALAEKTAKSQKKGIWKQKSPQPPWEFREGREI